MSLADAGACITYLMGAPRDGTDLCSAQAVLMQTFEMCSMLWSTVIATTLFFAIDGQDPWRERRARLAVAAAARRAGTKWRGAFKMEFLCARRGASTFRSGSRRRRGCDVDIPCRRVAAPPRLRREHSVQTSRGRVSRRVRTDRAVGSRAGGVGRALRRGVAAALDGQLRERGRLVLDQSQTARGVGRVALHDFLRAGVCAEIKDGSRRRRVRLLHVSRTICVVAAASLRPSPQR